MSSIAFRLMALVPVVRLVFSAVLVVRHLRPALAAAGAQFCGAPSAARSRCCRRAIVRRAIMDAARHDLPLQVRNGAARHLRPAPVCCPSVTRSAPMHDGHLMHHADCSCQSAPHPRCWLPKKASTWTVSGASNVACGVPSAANCLAAVDTPPRCAACANSNVTPPTTASTSNCAKYRTASLAAALPASVAWRSPLRCAARMSPAAASPAQMTGSHIGSHATSSS